MNGVASDLPHAAKRAPGSMVGARLGNGKFWREALLVLQKVVLHGRKMLAVKCLERSDTSRLLLWTWGDCVYSTRESVLFGERTSG